MPTLFVDTSALAKRYVDEIGSPWLRGMLDGLADGETFVVRTAAVEMTSAITRRERAGSLSPDHAGTARAAFRRHLLTEYQIVGLTQELAERAMALAETHALRAYDAIQLAAAVELNTLLVASTLPPLLLLSSDAELNTAALAEGLSVEDPNSHG